MTQAFQVTLTREQALLLVSMYSVTAASLMGDDVRGRRVLKACAEMLMERPDDAIALNDAMNLLNRSAADANAR